MSSLQPNSVRMSSAVIIGMVAVIMIIHPGAC
jgi:hypothetical protein